FQEMNLSTEEIDEILVRLNDTFAEKKIGDFVEKILVFVKRLMKNEANFIISNYQHELFRVKIMEHFRNVKESEKREFLKVLNKLQRLDDANLKKVLAQAESGEELFSWIKDCLPKE
ncbi:MAG: hypothetical protein QMD65_03005, partial [Patescibacteria group bacterium]|nr:hypothetical protein [Patescibacteria group bacterium]